MIEAILFIAILLVILAFLYWKLDSTNCSETPQENYVAGDSWDSEPETTFLTVVSPTYPGINHNGDPPLED